MCNVGPTGPQSGVDLRLHTPRCQGRESRLRSACFNLVAKFVTPFPYVWFCRCHDRKLNTSMDHEGSLYRTGENQLLLRLQSIRVNTGFCQSKAALLNVRPPTVVPS
jgi:hypothetical protein